MIVLMVTVLMVIVSTRVCVRRLSRERERELVYYIMLCHSML